MKLRILKGTFEDAVCFGLGHGRGDIFDNSFGSGFGLGDYGNPLAFGDGFGYGAGVSYDMKYNIQNGHNGFETET